MNLKFFGCLSCLGLLMTSCDQPAQQATQVDYKTMIISTSDESVKNQYTASITGRQYVEVRPQVGGVITEIKINEGAAVKKGQTLFVIDQVPYKAALETAKANVKSAEAKVATAKLNANSRKELYNEAVISEYDLQTAKNALLEAEAYLLQTKSQELNARNNLSYTEVKSPVDGVASMIPYHVGALVSSSIAEPLVTVSDDSDVFVYFSMTESQILDLTRTNGSLDSLKASMPEVELLLSDGTLYAHKGKINAISGTVDSNTGAVNLRAIFNNKDRVLRNGGTGRIIIQSEKPGSIAIPKKATYEIQNRVFVYKVIDGKATSSQIEVFPLDDGKKYIVESGLEVGDEIIAEGAGLVREGTVVKPNQNQNKEE